ncbi:hypothetical protein ACP70R_023504 [Stipagrostis hirtigluma subsp. patula]
MISSGALLCPISYLSHVSADACYYGHPSAELLQILDSLCDDELLDCNNLLSTITAYPTWQNGVADNAGPPVFLQQSFSASGGDTWTWFINSAEQSFGYILADSGFDIWIGNIHSTHWSKGHSTYLFMISSWRSIGEMYPQVVKKLAVDWRSIW